MMKGLGVGVTSLGLFIAVGMGVGGYFVGQTMYNAKVAVNTASAKGLAERVVKADVADWYVSFSVNGNSKQEIPRMYLIAEKHRKTVIETLQKSGLSDNEIKVGVIDYGKKEHRSKDQTLISEEHFLSCGIKVITEKVDQIETIRDKVNKLLVKGINISSGAPQYRFTKLNEIKPEMLREATKNARLAANEFAKNAGVQVGGIRNAVQGGFNIRDVGEEWSDTRKIDKTVRVVTTITFYLTD